MNENKSVEEIEKIELKWLIEIYKNYHPLSFVTGNNAEIKYINQLKDIRLTIEENGHTNITLHDFMVMQKRKK